MAKAFIRSLLERTIGRYVETDVAALNVAFWQGKIDLKDLRIRKDVVDSLGLPLVVEDGSAVAHVRVDVPWRQLSTKPVRVKVTGVRLRCALRADFSDPEELLRVETELRRAEISLREFLHKELLGAAQASAIEGQASYWEALGIRVMENLQVEVGDVEIWFADLFEVKLSLQSFTLRTADNKATPAGKASSNSSKTGWSKVSKVMHLSGLAVEILDPSAANQGKAAGASAKHRITSNGADGGGGAVAGVVVQPFSLSATVESQESTLAKQARAQRAAALGVLGSAEAVGTSDEPAAALLEDQPTAESGETAASGGTLNPFLPLPPPPPTSAGAANSSSSSSSDPPPRWTVAIDTVEPIACAVTRAQWAVALRVSLRFIAAADQRTRLLMRPRGMPCSQLTIRHRQRSSAQGDTGAVTGAAPVPPKEWWQFAVRALGFLKRPGGRGWSSFWYGFKRRKKYIALRTRQLLPEESPEEKSASSKTDKGNSSHSNSSAGANSSTGNLASNSASGSTGSSVGKVDGGAAPGGSDIVVPLSLEEEAWLEACHRDRPGESLDDRAVVLDALILWRATAEAEANALRNKRQTGKRDGSSMSSFDSGSNSSGYNPRAPLRKGLSSLMVTKTGKAKKFRPTKVWSKVTNLMGKKRPSDGSASAAMAAAANAAILNAQQDATESSNSHKYSAAELFAILDTNTDGTLSRDEVIAGANTLGLTVEEAGALFDDLDADGDGALVLAELAVLEEEDDDEGGGDDDEVGEDAGAVSVEAEGKPQSAVALPSLPSGNDLLSTGGNDLTAAERGALYASVMATQRELTLLSETDVWLQIRLNVGGLSVLVSDGLGPVLRGELKALSVEGTVCGVPRSQGGQGTGALAASLKLGDLSVLNLCTDMAGGSALSKSFSSKSPRPLCYEHLFRALHQRRFLVDVPGGSAASDTETTAVVDRDTPVLAFDVDFQPSAGKDSNSNDSSRSVSMISEQGTSASNNATATRSSIASKSRWQASLESRAFECVVPPLTEPQGCLPRLMQFTPVNCAPDADFLAAYASGHEPSASSAPAEATPTDNRQALLAMQSALSTKRLLDELSSYQRRRRRQANLRNLPSEGFSPVVLRKGGNDDVSSGGSTRNSEVAPLLALRCSVEAPLIVLPSDLRDAKAAVLVLDLGYLHVSAEPQPSNGLLRAVTAQPPSRTAAAIFGAVGTVGRSTPPIEVNDASKSTSAADASDERNWQLRCWRTQLTSVRLLTGNSVGFWRPLPQASASPSPISDHPKTSFDSNHVLLEEFSVDVQLGHAVALPDRDNLVSHKGSAPGVDQNSADFDRTTIDGGAETSFDEASSMTAALTRCVLRRDVYCVTLPVALVAHIDPSHLKCLRRVRNAHTVAATTTANPSSALGPTKASKSDQNTDEGDRASRKTSDEENSSARAGQRNLRSSRSHSVTGRRRNSTQSYDELGMPNRSGLNRGLRDSGAQKAAGKVGWLPVPTVYSASGFFALGHVEVRVRSAEFKALATFRVSGCEALATTPLWRGSSRRTQGMFGGATSGVPYLEGALRSVEVEDHMTASTFVDVNEVTEPFSNGMRTNSCSTSKGSGRSAQHLSPSMLVTSHSSLQTEASSASPETAQMRSATENERLIGLRVSRTWGREWNDAGEEVEVATVDVACLFTGVHVNWNPRTVAALMDLLPQLASSAPQSEQTPGHSLSSESTQRPSTISPSHSGLTDDNQGTRNSISTRKDSATSNANVPTTADSASANRFKLSASMQYFTVSLNDDPKSTSADNLPNGHIPTESPNDALRRLFLIEMAGARSEMVMGPQLPTFEDSRSAIHHHVSAQPEYAAQDANAASPSSGADLYSSSTLDTNGVDPDGMMIAGFLQHLEIWADEGHNKRLLRMLPSEVTGTKSDGTSSAPHDSSPGNSRKAHGSASSEPSREGGDDWLKLRYFRPYDREDDDEDSDGSNAEINAATVVMEARPIEVVLVHSQALQALYYINDGVMGALFRSAASAAQALLEKAGVSLQMHCVLQGARMLLPLSLWRRVAVVVDCKSVEINHRIMQGALLYEGELKASGVQVATRTRALRLRHRVQLTGPRTILDEPTGGLRRNQDDGRQINNTFAGNEGDSEDIEDDTEQVDVLDWPISASATYNQTRLSAEVFETSNVHKTTGKSGADDGKEATEDLRGPVTAPVTVVLRTHMSADMSVAEPLHAALSHPQLQLIHDCMSGNLLVFGAPPRGLPSNRRFTMMAHCRLPEINLRCLEAINNDRGVGHQGEAASTTAVPTRVIATVSAFKVLLENEFHMDKTTVLAAQLEALSVVDGRPSCTTATSDQSAKSATSSATATFADSKASSRKYSQRGQHQQMQQQRKESFNAPTNNVPKWREYRPFRQLVQPFPWGGTHDNDDSNDRDTNGANLDVEAEKVKDSSEPPARLPLLRVAMYSKIAPATALHVHGKDDSEPTAGQFDRSFTAHVEALQFWACADAWLELARWADLDFRPRGTPDKLDDSGDLLPTFANLANLDPSSAAGGAGNTQGREISSLPEATAAVHGLRVMTAQVKVKQCTLVLLEDWTIKVPVDPKTPRYSPTYSSNAGSTNASNSNHSSSTYKPERSSENLEQYAWAEPFGDLATGAVEGADSTELSAVAAAAALTQAAVALADLELTVYQRDEANTLAPSLAGNSNGNSRSSSSSSSSSNRYDDVLRALPGITAGHMNLDLAVAQLQLFRSQASAADGKYQHPSGPTGEPTGNPFPPASPPNTGRKGGAEEEGMKSDGREGFSRKERKRRADSSGYDGHSGSAAAASLEVQILEPTVLGLQYERRRQAGTGATNEAFTVGLESVDAAVSHDDLLLLTRTGQRIAHTVALDFEQHQHDFSPRKDALARANAAGRGSTHLGAVSRSSTSAPTTSSGAPPPSSSYSSPAAKTRKSQTSSYSAGATSFSPPESTVKTSGELSSYLQDSYFGDGGRSDHDNHAGPNTTSGEAPLSPRLRASNRSALRGSTAGATNGVRTSVGGGQGGEAGGNSSEALAVPVENSRSWTISCENGLQIEVISDEPRAPLRFMRRRRHRRPKMNPGLTEVGGTNTSSGSDYTVAAANAPLFKFQVAACYVIAHSTPGAYIVRVDDLAFTVLYYDANPFLAAIGAQSVPTRWNALTTVPFVVSASFARGADSTDQVTVRGSALRVVVNDSSVQNASSLAAIAAHLATTIQESSSQDSSAEFYDDHYYDDDYESELNDDSTSGAAAAASGIETTATGAGDGPDDSKGESGAANGSLMVVGGTGSGDNGGYMLLNETGVSLLFESREVGEGGWGDSSNGGGGGGGGGRNVGFRESVVLDGLRPMDSDDDDDSDRGLGASRNWSEAWDDEEDSDNSDENDERDSDSDSEVNVYKDRKDGGDVGGDWVNPQRVGPGSAGMFGFGYRAGGGVGLRRVFGVEQSVVVVKVLGAKPLREYSTLTKAKSRQKQQQNKPKQEEKEQAVKAVAPITPPAQSLLPVLPSWASPSTGSTFTSISSPVNEGTTLPPSPPPRSTSPSLKPPRAKQTSSSSLLPQMSRWWHALEILNLEGLSPNELFAGPLPINPDRLDSGVGSINDARSWSGTSNGSSNTKRESSFVSASSKRTTAAAAIPPTPPIKPGPPAAVYFSRRHVNASTHSPFGALASSQAAGASTGDSQEASSFALRTALALRSRVMVHNHTSLPLVAVVLAPINSSSDFGVGSRDDDDDDEDANEVVVVTVVPPFSSSPLPADAVHLADSVYLCPARADTWEKGLANEKAHRFRASSLRASTAASSKSSTSRSSEGASTAAATATAAVDSAPEYREGSSEESEITWGGRGFASSRDGRACKRAALRRGVAVAVAPLGPREANFREATHQVRSIREARFWGERPVNLSAVAAKGGTATARELAVFAAGWRLSEDKDRTRGDDSGARDRNGKRLEDDDDDRGDAATAPFVEEEDDDDELAPRAELAVEAIFSRPLLPTAQHLNSARQAWPRHHRRGGNGNGNGAGASHRSGVNASGTHDVLRGGFDVVDIHVSSPLRVENHCPVPLDLVWSADDPFAMPSGDSMGESSSRSGDGNVSPTAKFEHRLRLWPRASTPVYEMRMYGSAFRFETVPSKEWSGGQRRNGHKAVANNSSPGHEGNQERSGSSSIHTTNSWTVDLLRDVGNRLSLRMREAAVSSAPKPESEERGSPSRAATDSAGAKVPAPSVATLLLHVGIANDEDGTMGGQQQSLPGAIHDGPVTVRVGVPCVLVDRSGLNLALRQPSTHKLWPSARVFPHTNAVTASPTTSIFPKIMPSSSSSSSGGKRAATRTAATNPNAHFCNLPPVAVPLVPEGQHGLVSVSCRDRHSRSTNDLTTTTTAASASDEAQERRLGALTVRTLLEEDAEGVLSEYAHRPIFFPPPDLSSRTATPSSSPGGSPSPPSPPQASSSSMARARVPTWGCGVFVASPGSPDFWEGADTVVVVPRVVVSNRTGLHLVVRQAPRKSSISSSSSSSSSSSLPPLSGVVALPAGADVPFHLAESRALLEALQLLHLRDLEEGTIAEASSRVHASPPKASESPTNTNKSNSSTQGTMSGRMLEMVEARGIDAWSSPVDLAAAGDAFQGIHLRGRFAPDPNDFSTGDDDQGMNGSSSSNLGPDEISINQATNAAARRRSRLGWSKKSSQSKDKSDPNPIRSVLRGVLGTSSSSSKSAASAGGSIGSASTNGPDLNPKLAETAADSMQFGGVLDLLVDEDSSSEEEDDDDDNVSVVGSGGTPAKKTNAPSVDPPSITGFHLRRKMQSLASSTANPLKQVLAQSLRGSDGACRARVRASVVPGGRDCTLRVWLSLDGEDDNDASNGNSSDNSSTSAVASNVNDVASAPLSEGNDEEGEDDDDDDDDLRFGALQVMGEGEYLGAGLAGEDGDRLVILKAAAQARRLLVDFSMEAIEIELMRPQTIHTLPSLRSLSPAGGDMSSPLVRHFATMVVRGLVITGRVDADGFVRRQQRHVHTRGLGAASPKKLSSRQRRSYQRSSTTGANRLTQVDNGSGGAGGGVVVVRERHQSTGTRTVKASVAYFVVLNHLDHQAVMLGALYPSTSAAAAHTLLAGHGAHMCSLELTWRLQRIKTLGRSNYRSNDSFASPPSSFSSSAGRASMFSPGRNSTNKSPTPTQSRMSLFSSRSSSAAVSPSQLRASSGGRGLRGGNGRQKLVHEVIVERCSVAVVPLLLRTSERFLWVLAAAEVSFGRALRAPWPSDYWQKPKPQGAAAAAATNNNIPWTLVVRQLNVTALKLNLNYTKGVGTTRPSPASSSSSRHMPTPSDDRYPGSMVDQGGNNSMARSSSFSSIASDSDSSFASGTTSNSRNNSAAAAIASIGDGNGGRNLSQRNGTSRRNGQAPQYPESTLAFALRALRVSLSNATVELRDFALVAWRGAPNALAARLAHHYLTQLKQWTFTLLTAASPSFGFGYFRSQNQRNHAPRLLTEQNDKAAKKAKEQQK